MSRLKRFAHSLISGYVLLGANMVYTLASVPLALSYLSRKEFALWALATQVTSYIALVDFGLSASASRVLIDYKDRRSTGEYGSMVQTGALVGLTQGTLVMAVGLVVSFFIGPLLEIDQTLQHDFKWLMVGQCVLVAVGFYVRIVSHMLTAHQRYDIANYTSAGLFGLSFVVMWWCFEHGFGVYSTIWGLAVGTVASILVICLACSRLKFFPRQGEWGKPNWRAFKELFAFARDFFIFAVGAQMINASQIILLQRLSGLEAVATWSVCTRVFLVLSQVVSRVFDYSSAALAEMIVRQEMALLQKRFREIVTFSACLSVAAAAMLALCNSTFVSVWTSGRFNSLEVFPEDIKAPAELASRLFHGADGVSAELWKQISPETKTLVRESILSQHPAASDETKEVLKRLFSSEFNRIFQSTYRLNQTNVVASNLTPETISLFGRPETKNEQFRLNRYLAEDCLGDVFASSRKCYWSPWNDLLLGIWLVVCAVINCHTGLVGQTKKFHFMRYLTFIEGTVFIVLTIAFHQWGGMTMMLMLSILCGLAFRLPYGLFRTISFFSVSKMDMVSWHACIARMLLWIVPVALAIWFSTRGLSNYLKFWVAGSSMALWAGFVVLRFGVPANLKTEVAKRAPHWLKPLLSRLSN